MTDQRLQDGEALVAANHPTRNDTINRLTLVEHSSAGKHKVISLEEQASIPSASTDFGKLYTKDVSGVTELFYLDSAGNEVQLTGGGEIMGGQDIQAIEVTIDSDGTASWETKNVTITEVADASKYSINIGRYHGSQSVGIADDVGGTINTVAHEIRTRLTSTTNLELYYLDSSTSNVSSIIPIFITAKLA